MPTPTGAIIRSTTGRLQRDIAGRQKRCGCCSPTGSCPMAIHAVPCYQLLDNCNRLLPDGVWICTDAICVDTFDPIGSAVPRTVIVHYGDYDYCVRTEPGTEKPTDTLTEDELAHLELGPLQCAAIEEGCADARCGVPEDPCNCICANFLREDTGPGAIIPETFCCFGKVRQTDHGPVTCWSWSLTGLFKEEIRFDKFRGGYPGASCGQEVGCDAEDACVMTHVETRSVPPDGDDPCDHACCYAQKLQDRRIVHKYFDVTSTCPVTVCRMPNDADGLWHDRPGGEGPYTEMVCVPVNTGRTEEHIDVFPDGNALECPTFFHRTIISESTCDRTEYTIIDETSDPWEITGCDDGLCCKCAVYRKVTTSTVITFGHPQSSDVECGQCKQYRIDNPP